MNLSERIRESLKQHGMTQAQFADRLGMAESQMSRIINLGQDVRLSTYTRIDEALKALDREAASRS